MPRRSSPVRQHAFQSSQPAAQQSPRAHDGTARLRNLEGHATVRELAEELRFTVTAPQRPEKACRDWLTRWKVPTLRRGKRILVSRRDVDYALRQQQAQLRVLSRTA